MFHFFKFPMTFRMRPRICTSRFYNLSNWIPIKTWDTSMNLYLKSLINYIKIFVLSAVQIFNPFSCSDFSFFQWLSEWEPKTAHPDDLSNWIPILSWDTSMNLWLNSLIFYIEILLIKEDPNFDPFLCSGFPSFQWFSGAVVKSWCIMIITTLFLKFVQLLKLFTKHTSKTDFNFDRNSTREKRDIRGLP